MTEAITGRLSKSIPSTHKEWLEMESRLTGQLAAAFVICECFHFWHLVKLPEANQAKVCPATKRFRSVQFSCSVVSDTLWPHESQHTRPPCPSPTPGVHSDSRPSSQWCHPDISSSVIPFSSCLRFSPAWESLPMSQLLLSCGQSFRPSVSSGYSGLIYFKIDWSDLLAVQGPP